MLPLWVRRCPRAVKKYSVPSRATRIHRLHTTSPIFQVSEEVQQALSERRPVVALETAVYTHGFPYPDNIALASLLESIVRTNGGVPATIGVLNGVARVGLDGEELIQLASSTGQASTRKVSRRDLAFICGTSHHGKRYHGGTTIAGTMLLAHKSGIRVFATGGLGGVHRGAETSMDISADLTELGRTPVAVISSGCKAFLDIPRTLEYLETQGVAVATFADGREGNVDFPGFWSRDSGSASPMTIASEADAAAMIHAQSVLGVQSGLCLSNPIPVDLSIPKAEIDEAIHQAIKEANEAGATGNANTPFILDRIKKITGARSVEVNRGLLAANAKRGALVAVELAKLEHDQGQGSLSGVMTGPAAVNYAADGTSRDVPTLTKTASATEQAHESPLAVQPPTVSTSSQPQAKKLPAVIVAGSIAVDLACDCLGPFDGSRTKLHMHTSNPAAITQSIGGVGHNVARAIHLLGVDVRLCSITGEDLAGQTLRNALQAVGMDALGLKTLAGGRTAQYVAVNDADRSLTVAMADMTILEQDTEGIEADRRAQLVNDRPSHVVVDGNWSVTGMRSWLEAARAASATTIFEPVSVAKSTRLFQASQALRVYPNHLVDLASPNSYELTAMHAAAREAGYFDRQDWWEIVDSFGIPSTGVSTQLGFGTSPELVEQGIPQQSIQLLPFIPKILTKLGSDGVLLTQLLPAGDKRLTDGEYAPYILSRSGVETEGGVGGIYMRLFPPAEKVPLEDIVSVNGVGDTFLGAVVAGLIRRSEGHNLEDLVPLAQRAAIMTLKSTESVSPGLGNLLLAGL